MRKFVLFAALLSLALAGCSPNTNEKLANLERRAEELEARLATSEGKLDTCQGDIFALSQRQDMLEGYQKKGEPGASTAMSAQDIQTALKNAGFYTGAVDGKIGPNTDKAIRDFQKANGLNPDGVVGTKTSSLLGKYLKQ